jgi:C-terminal processing protease CtpA/Prc
MIEFESIVILVDENTASASELFTLSLSEFLDNVTIIGRTTFGKGVGQTVYEDIKNEYVIYLVSFYWNVMEQNINKTGIEPDILIEGTELSDFLDRIP